MKTIKFYIVSLIFCLVNVSYAGYEEGLSFYNQKDYLSAFKEWYPLAISEDAKSQHALGSMYFDGKWVN